MTEVTRSRGSRSSTPRPGHHAAILDMGMTLHTDTTYIHTLHIQELTGKAGGSQQRGEGSGLHTRAGTAACQHRTSPSQRFGLRARSDLHTRAEGHHRRLSAPHVAFATGCWISNRSLLAKWVAAYARGARIPVSLRRPFRLRHALSPPRVWHGLRPLLSLPRLRGLPRTRLSSL